MPQELKQREEQFKIQVMDLIVELAPEWRSTGAGLTTYAEVIKGLAQALDVIYTKA